MVLLVFINAQRFTIQQMYFYEASFSLIRWIYEHFVSNLTLNRDIINSKSLCDFCRYISRMERLMRIFLMSLLPNIAIRPP